MILHRLRGLFRSQGQSAPVSVPDERRARERMHEEWERDYRRRVLRLYQLERRANYLTERLLAPIEDEEGR